MNEFGGLMAFLITVFVILKKRPSIFDLMLVIEFMIIAKALFDGFPYLTKHLWALLGVDFLIMFLAYAMAKLTGEE